MHFIKTPTLYWAPPQRTGDGGFVWGFPEETLAKWDYKASVFYSDSGAMAMSNATVWLERKVDLGGYLWRGTLKEVTSFSNPEPDTDFTRNEYHLFERNLMKLDVLSLASSIKSVEDIHPLRESKGMYLRKVLVI